MRKYIPAILLGAILFIPFLGAVHLFDWDEINFAECAREMLLSGNYLHVQMNFHAFWEKPPLFFWLQAASMNLFGVHAFAARFPNAVCGILTFCVILQVGRKYFSGRLAWLWILFMAGSFTPHLYFESGIIDPWLNLFIFLAVLALMESSLPQNSDRRLWLWIRAGILIGLGTLTKGPVAILIPLLCLGVWLALNRMKFFFSLRDFLACALAVLLVVGLWPAAEMITHGPGILIDFIRYQIDLFLHPVATHGEPWYYHPVVLLIGCFPASFFSLAGFRNQEAEGDRRAFHRWMTLLFWVVLILFSIVRTKIIHYSSLCYLPLTFLAAYAVDRLLQTNKPMNRLLLAAMTLFGLLMGSLLTLVPLIDRFKAKLLPYIRDPFAVANLRQQVSWQGWEFLVGAAFLVVLLISVWMQIRGNLLAGTRVLTLGFAFLFSLYLFVVGPRIEQYTQGGEIALFQSLQGKKVYVQTLGYKSYAQYYYTRAQKPANPRYTDLEWLLKGPIDQPAYFMIKSKDLPDYTAYHLHPVARKGGFTLLLRKPGYPVAYPP